MEIKCEVERGPTSRLTYDLSFTSFLFANVNLLFQGVFLVRLLTFVLFVALLFLLASVAYLALDS